MEVVAQVRLRRRELFGQ